MNIKGMSTSALLLLCLCIAFKPFAQTTMEEYNYVTKGYKIQLESGLDMKKGYELAHLGKKEISIRNAELKVLYRLNEAEKTKEVAAYMIIYKKKGANTEYICIPHPESSTEIKELYWKQLYTDYNSKAILATATNASERLQIITFLISDYMLWK